MKPLITIFLVAVCLISQSFLGLSRTPSIYPIFDAPGAHLPRNFRKSDDKQILSFIDANGLKFLRASGSGQFSEKTFVEMLQVLSVAPEKVVVMDLRQESHGFINGKPVSWTDGNYNYGNLHKSKREVESDEYQRLKLAEQSKKIIIDPSGDSTKLTVRSVKTERDFVESNGCQYIRMPVTDLNRPSNEVVDQFIAYVKNLPEDQWIHFHCKAGKGRTTTFMTLLDIMRNGQNVAFNEIMARQKFIGGSDLTSIEKPDMEKSRAAKERLEFVKKFYHYCRQVPNYRVSWSEWIDQQQTICANPSSKSVY